MGSLIAMASLPAALHLRTSVEQLHNETIAFNASNGYAPPPHAHHYRFLGGGFKDFWNFHPAKKGGNDPNLMTILFQFGGLNHQATSLGLLQPPHDMARIQKQLAD